MACKLFIGDFKKKFAENIANAMDKVGEIVTESAKSKVPEDTGDLKNTMSHKLNKSGKKVFIGNDSKYAQSQEFGTGIYHANGRGRKTPWTYKTKDGNYVRTKGFRPQPFLRPAINEHTGKIGRLVALELMKGLGGK